MGKLYRGVSKVDDQNHNGRLFPKGNIQKVTMKCGDKGLKFDGKFTHGPSKNNTARSHQVESGMHEGCCISTTRCKDTAEYFATSGNLEDGFVYILDEELLDKYNIIQQEFIDAENPHEHEVTLMAEGGGEITTDVILDKYEVNHT